MIAKVKAKYAESGWVGLLLSAVRRLPGVNAICTYYVYLLSFDEHKALPSQERYRIEVFEKESCLNDLTGIQEKAEIFRNRFLMQHFCVIAYADEKAVAYLWGQEGPRHTEQRYGFDVMVAKKQIFYYDSYTCPEWRQKGLLRCLLQKTISYSEKERQKGEVAAIIEADNLVSQKAHEKIGFRKDRLELFVNLLGRNYLFRLFSFR